MCYQVGFLYDSVVEDVMTGTRLHCRGWNSVYYNPPRPQFLGSAPINLNDVLVQYKRWSSGLLEIAFSRYSPLPYGIMSGHSILHTMCLSYPASMPFYCVFGLCYATVPQLCLLNGISLYPKVKQNSVSELNFHSFQCFNWHSFQPFAMVLFHLTWYYIKCISQ